MKKLLLLTITPWLLSAGYHANISPIAPAVKQRMIRGHSWHRGCPVSLADLQYLRMTYHGFDGRDHIGEMVVHRNVARDVTQVFGEMYRSGYPIKAMKLVSTYGGNDTVSINHDNTSAFNCRAVTGGTKWSNHSYGTAIDINPLENPYISRSGHIAHRESYAYDRRHRTHHGAHPRSVIVSGDPIIRSFKRRGWRWGGDWGRIKDYQHFDKPGAQRGGKKSSSIPPRSSRRFSAPQTPHKPIRQAHTSHASDRYTVQPGDTLYKIAREHGTTTAKLMELNGITNANNIQIGKPLILSK